MKAMDLYILMYKNLKIVQIIVTLKWNLIHLKIQANYKKEKAIFQKIKNKKKRMVMILHYGKNLKKMNQNGIHPGV